MNARSCGGRGLSSCDGKGAVCDHIMDGYQPWGAAWHASSDTLNPSCHDAIVGNQLPATGLPVTAAPPGAADGLADAKARQKSTPSTITPDKKRVLQLRVCPKTGNGSRMSCLLPNPDARCRVPAPLASHGKYRSGSGLTPTSSWLLIPTTPPQALWITTVTESLRAFNLLTISSDPGYWREDAFGWR